MVVELRIYECIIRDLIERHLFQFDIENVVLRTITRVNVDKSRPSWIRKTIGWRNKACDSEKEMIKDK